jgi:hypothetical protein
MQRFRWSGLSSFVNRMLVRLAAAPGEPELRELHHALSTTSRRLEISVSVNKLEASQLTANTRALRAWAAFFSDFDGLRGYVEAVKVATPLVEAAVLRQQRWKPPVRVYLRPLRGVYQLRQRRDGAELSLPTPAVCFNPEDFNALVPYIFSADVRAKRHVLSRMQSEEFQAITAELDVLAGAVDVATGAVYDLNDIFDRVNATFFQGEVKRPKLFWSRSLTRRKFGHYDWVGDAVMMSRTMDDPKVPAFVVEFVMYHELLHKTLGLRWSGGRQYAHTAEFYRQEKLFPRHADAEAALLRLAREPN